MPLVSVRVAWCEVTLEGTITSVTYEWCAPDGSPCRHTERCDQGLLEHEIEGMRKLIFDRVNGDPFP